MPLSCHLSEMSKIKWWKAIIYSWKFKLIFVPGRWQFCCGMRVVLNATWGTKIPLCQAKGADLLQGVHPPPQAVNDPSTALLAPLVANNGKKSLFLAHAKLSVCNTHPPPPPSHHYHHHHASTIGKSVLELEQCGGALLCLESPELFVRAPEPQW